MALVKTLHNHYLFTRNQSTGLYALTKTTALSSQGYEDVRSPLVKSEAGKWRPPLSYERTVQVLGPYSRILEAERNHPIYATVRYYSTGAIQDNMGGLFPSLPAWPQNLENRAVNAALSSLKQQKIHLGVAFGERKQTAAFVTDTLGEVRQLYRSVRRGDLNGVKHQLWRRFKKQRHYKNTLHEVLDAPSALILKNSYALKPLVADIYGAIEVLNDKDRADPTRYATRTRVEMVGEPFKYSREFFESNHSVNHSWNADQEGYHHVVVRLDYYLANPFLASLASSGITNPLEIAWELVPFSFVVDWVYPVGSYLSTLDATLGLNFRGGSITRTTKTTVKLSPGLTPPKVLSSDARWKVVTYQQLENSSRGARQIRTKRIALLHSPTGRLPSFKNPFSFPRLAVAIALLAQLANKGGIRRSNRI